MGNRNAVRLSLDQLGDLDRIFMDALRSYFPTGNVPEFEFTGHVQSGSPDLAHIIIGRVKVKGTDIDVPTVTVLEDECKWGEYVRISAEGTAASLLDDLGK